MHATWVVNRHPSNERTYTWRREAGGKLPSWRGTSDMPSPLSALTLPGKNEKKTLLPNQNTHTCLALQAGGREEGDACTLGSSEKGRHCLSTTLPPPPAHKNKTGTGIQGRRTGQSMRVPSPHIKHGGGSRQAASAAAHFLLHAHVSGFGGFLQQHGLVLKASPLRWILEEVPKLHQWGALFYRQEKQKQHA